MIELKEIYEKIMSLFQIDNIENLSDKINTILFSDKKEDVFDDYISIVNDLSIDWIRRIYQFYLADRQDKKQDYTPKSISELLAKLTMTTNEKYVYDCCSGSGSLTIEKWNANHSLKFICEELDLKVIPFLLFNLSIRNIEGYVVNKDILSDDVFKVYKLIKGDKYSTIKLLTTNIDIKCETAISNPPYNIKYENQNANYLFVDRIINKLNDEGKAAILLPMACLTSDIEKEKRKILINENYVRGIITLPDKMFESTSIPTCLILIDKNKKSDEIIFIDSTSNFEIQIRKQKGELHTKNRIYEKQFKVLGKDNISKILNVLSLNQNQTGFSQIVKISETINNDYNLSPSKYIKYEYKEKNYRKYEEIILDINKIRTEKNKLCFTINETIAKKLGFVELFDLQKKGNQMTEETNESIKKIIDVKLFKEKYITLSKNKNEFKIENKDSESLSSIIMIMVQIFKQHLYYLNEEENKYLIELRDTLLPDLMDGKIEL